MFSLFFSPAITNNMSYLNQSFSIFGSEVSFFYIVSVCRNVGVVILFDGVLFMTLLNWETSGITHRGDV